MQLVVVNAVRNAVSAATTTFTASSIILFFVILCVFFLRILGFKDFDLWIFWGISGIFAFAGESSSFDSYIP